MFDDEVNNKIKQMSSELMEEIAVCINSEVDRQDNQKFHLTFTLLKSIQGYEIYYCVPEMQRKVHCGIVRTSMFVMLSLIHI